MALSNFLRMVKPGGILVIDHRNYDEILETGSVPAKNIYYNVSAFRVLVWTTAFKKWAIARPIKKVLSIGQDVKLKDDELIHVCARIILVRKVR